jgi:serine/threonine-protein kinase
VTADGGVKITDFGIAWSAGSVPLTRTGQVIGTAQYLSPEQAEGRHATPASDVYALGLVGYECLTGRPAFDGDNPVTIALKQVRQEPDPLPGELPAPVRGLIMRALVKDPGLRYPDAAAFAAALADAAAGRSTAAVELPAAAAGLPPASVPPPGSRPAGDPPTHAGSSRASRISPPVHHRRRTVTAVLVPLIALLVGAVIAAVVLQGLSRDNTPSPAAATNKLADPGIVLAAETYVGRPVDDVADDLAHRGLQVQRRAVDVPGGVPDLVTDVSPVGTQLALGDVVVVSYVAERAATGTGAGAGRGNGTWSTQRGDATVLGDGPPAAPTGSPTTATGSSSSAAATTSSSPPTTTAAASSAPETSAGTTSSSPTTSSSTSTSRSRSTSTSAATSTATTARR